MKIFLLENNKRICFLINIFFSCFNCFKKFIAPVNFIQQDIPMQVFEEPKMISHVENQPPPAYSSLKFF